MRQEIEFSDFPSGLDRLSTLSVPSSPAQELEAPPSIPDALNENAIILDRFRAYLRVKQGQMLHFSGPDPRTGELQEVTVPAANTSRYFKAGRKKIQRKLRQRLGQGQTPSVLLTLTIAQRQYSKREAWAMIWQEYAVFRRSLWKFLQRRGWKHNPLYVAVIEQHKSGYPHLHICYPGLRYLAPKEIISGCWRMGTTHIKGSRRGGPGVLVSALRYVLKYITKISGWTEEGLAHLWAARSRLYNISPKLYAIPKEPKAPGWLLTKIDYIDEALKDMARRLARLRFLERRRRKEVPPHHYV